MALPPRPRPWVSRFWPGSRCSTSDLARITGANTLESLMIDSCTICGAFPYARPGRACSPIDEVDVRSDVYPPGVILHALLCGSRRCDVRRAALSETIRVIRERPSRPLRRALGCARLPQPRSLEPGTHRQAQRGAGGSRPGAGGRGAGGWGFWLRAGSWTFRPGAEGWDLATGSCPQPPRGALRANARAHGARE
jgi:hypothetical protein